LATRQARHGSSLRNGQGAGGGTSPGGDGHGFTGGQVSNEGADEGVAGGRGVYGVHDEHRDLLGPSGRHDHGAGAPERDDGGAGAGGDQGGGGLYRLVPHSADGKWDLARWGAASLTEDGRLGLVGHDDVDEVEETGRQIIRRRRRVEDR